MNLFIPNVGNYTEDIHKSETYTFNGKHIGIIPGYTTFTITAYPDENDTFAYVNYETSKLKNFGDIKVIFSSPCTIIIDGKKKTIVRTQNGENANRRKGLIMCLLKHSVSSQEFTEITKPYFDHPKMECAAAYGALSALYGAKKVNDFIDRWM